MRVCFFAPLGFPLGGAPASRVRSLASGLQLAGAEVKVFACGDSSGSADGDICWRNVSCVLARPPESAGTSDRRGGYLRQAVRRLVRGRAGQEQVNYLLGRLEQELSLERTDVVILYHQQLPLALRFFDLCRRYRVKFVQQYAEMHTPGDYQHGIFTMYYLRERFHLAVAPRLAEGNLVISRWLERAVVRRGARQVLRVPALGNTEQTPGTLPGPPTRMGSEMILTYLGAGGRRDCLPELLTAVARARSLGAMVNLRCVGLSADAHTGLRKLVEGMSVHENVELLGRVEDGTLQHVLADTDVFVLLRSPDRSAEACFPTRLPEFLATGRPVILTEVGDIGLYFENRVNALLVRPGDLGGVADAIKVLAGDRELRIRLGRAGAESGAVDFDPARQGRRLHGWLRTLTGSTGN